MVSTCSLIVFTIKRFFEGDLFLVLLDGTLAVIMGAAGYYSHKTKNFQIARISLVYMSVIGVLIACYHNALFSLYWCYVLVAMVFYLINYKKAALVNIIVISTCYYFISTQDTAVDPTSFLMTIILLFICTFVFSYNNYQYHIHLNEILHIDELTGAKNRRAFKLKSKELIELYKRKRIVSSIMYLDIDKFKYINDTYGHDVGDDVIIKITKKIKENLRGTDELYRLGGDEFVIVSTSSNKKNTATLGRRLCREVENLNIIQNESITISIGVSETIKSDNEGDMLKRADTALYSAKKSGRNTVA